MANNVPDGAASFEALYSASMALNNMGVSLLQHGRRQQAKEAFSDALCFVRDLSTASTAKDGTVSQDAIASKIATTSHKVASCFGTASGVRPFSSYCIVDQDNCAEVLRKSLLPSRFNEWSVKIPLIRLEQTASCTTCARTRGYYPALESSVILFNCAIAHLYSSDCLDYESLLKAHKLLQLSTSTMDTLSLTCDAEEDYAITGIVLPLSVIMYRQLAQVSLMMNVTDAYSNYLVLTLSLEEKFLQSDALTRHLPPTGARAA